MRSFKTHIENVYAFFFDATHMRKRANANANAKRKRTSVKKEDDDKEEEGEIKEEEEEEEEATQEDPDAGKTTARIPMPPSVDAELLNMYFENGVITREEYIKHMRELANLSEATPQMIKQLESEQKQAEEKEIRMDAKKKEASAKPKK